MTVSRHQKTLSWLGIFLCLQFLAPLFSQDLKSTITVVGDVEKSGEYPAPSTVQELLTRAGFKTSELTEPSHAAAYDLWLYRDGEKIALELGKEAPRTLAKEILPGSSLQITDYRKIDKRDLPDGNGFMHTPLLRGLAFWSQCHSLSLEDHWLLRGRNVCGPLVSSALGV